MIAEERARPRAGAFVWVWLGLLALTGLTVGMATAPLGRLGAIITVLVIAGVKSGLVAAWFMGLRYEKRKLYLLLPAITVVILVVVYWLTFTDISIRYR